MSCLKKLSLHTRFELVHANIVGLESTALDRSAKVANSFNSFQSMTAAINDTIVNGLSAASTVLIGLQPIGESNS